MRIMPPVLFFAVAAAMIAAHFLLPGPALLPPLVRWLGLPVFALGAWINGAGAARFHRTGTNIRTFDDPTRLVTDGLWGMSRNPIYLGFLLMLLGGGIGSGAAIPLLLAALFGVVVDRWYIRFEEAALTRLFGADYEAYRAKVRRWL